ncbi:hypothetical protein POL68_16185 [Stigmatella sp. ncwal1]|uniref:DUF4263 domain-containing protein n=1 Tax=Stigmatella ashevillensis TaxID=2995309 RepID=A0ABT5DAA0_9BACT|nr:hypothetical protein [Stigmatella ashevillena]MDC0710015.1 hypothetical protein [Stigmatella ashevillena]
MPSTRSEKEAQELLESNHFFVEKISESDRRTADFFVSKNNDSYLIEVTEKEPANAFTQMIQTASKEGLGTLIRELNRNNRLDGIIKEKVDQLRTTDRESEFRLLWIAGLHGDADFLRDVLTQTLYGIAQLLVFHSTNLDVLNASPPTPRACFYYDYFSFYRLPDLDGVIFSAQGRKTLFVNPFGDKTSAFRKSEMHDLFKTIGTVADPDTIKDPSVLFLGLDVDRSDQRAKWEYIKKTYGILTSRMVESSFHGVLPF